ncbi:hypothetical protein Moror_9667 [Moniliophthora roreri MCA 2997]|uniref:Uncharacterized protein n=1 Tax=Moniliophthora roreri (strain MCA 2997) TaxID=1381753 RepID=V2WIJ5_MONRO|nr:hypothetical protein Moror_9667 [Moniliophthora roreri MCA 2997]
MYSANLAYNATTRAAGGLVLQGPIMVLSPMTFVIQIQTVQNSGWLMPHMQNEFTMQPSWPVNSLNKSPPSPHPALVYLGHLIKPDPQPPFIPEMNDSPPPLQVPGPLSILIPPAPLATMDQSPSNMSPPLNLEVPPCMQLPSESEPHPLPVLAPRPSNPMWRISTPQEFRDATTATPPPWYHSALMEHSTPISNPSELPMQSNKKHRNLSLANRRPMPIPPRTLIRDPTIQSMWDNEDLEEALSSEPSSSLTNSDDMTDEVYKYLSALCAEWQTTAAKNAHTTIVKFAGRLRLVTSLEIVISNEGRDTLLAATIPSAHHLLTIISTGVTPTPSSTETESSESTVATENAEEQYEVLFVCPSLAFELETGTATKPSITQISSLTEATPGSVAYCVIFFALTTHSTWTWDKVNGMNIQQLYLHVIEIFDKASTKWLEEYWEWFNREVFAKSSDEDMPEENSEMSDLFNEFEQAKKDEGLLEFDFDTPNPPASPNTSEGSADANIVAA